MRIAEREKSCSPRQLYYNIKRKENQDMREELKGLYGKLMDLIDSDEPDEECEKALSAIIDYENALFKMHFGEGTEFRKIVICGLCLGVSELILEKADFADMRIIDDVKAVVKECICLTGEKEERKNDRRIEYEI